MFNEFALKHQDKMFNKYALKVAVLILLLSSIIKIHSIYTAPEISDWNYHQLQKIDHSKSEFSFAVFGDNKNSANTFENLISKLNSENQVIFAIDVGDTVNDGEVEKFRFFLDQVSHLNKPLLTVFGNHEARDNGRAVYYHIFGKFYYSFNIGNNYFIILDNSNKQNINDEQLHWLKEELKNSQGYKNRFVFMHVPLYDPRVGSYKEGHSLGDLDFAKKLNKLFDEQNVTMLFVSHIHGYYKGVWGKTPYIITGGAGAELAGSDPDHYFYHYMKVNVNDSDVNYDVVKLDSPEYELLDRWLHDIWIYIYAFFAIHFIDSILLLALAYFGIYFILIKWRLRIKTIREQKNT